jgi:general secretion pathway protein G
MSPAYTRSNEIAGERTGIALRARRIRRISSAAGMTLLELLIACAILVILSTVALPLARVELASRREAEVRRDLREMRDAIDRYKDDADKNLIQIDASNTEHYPPDLSTLVNGVQLTSAQNKRVHYLSKIPTDPLTGDTNWGLRSVEDDQDTTSWGGQDVFDVYSRATGTALNGTKYSDW